jgi:shikimate kinase
VAAVIVLLGAPGSGKSSIGEALGRRGVRWRNWEQTLVERWGSRDEFLDHKAAALEHHHRELAAWIASDPAPCAIETTGLSDHEWLQELRGTYVTVIVRVDVDEATATHRMRSRQPGRHLSDDPLHQRAVWEAFREPTAPRLDADLVIDTLRTSADDAAEMILDLLR